MYPFRLNHLSLGFVFTVLAVIPLNACSALKGLTTSAESPESKLQASTTQAIRSEAPTPQLIQTHLAQLPQASKSKRTVKTPTKSPTMSTKLSPQDLDSQLKQLDGWTIQNGKLHREYKFPSFVEAFGFMSSLALVSESMGHHPEWSNVYNRITVDLTTHDAGGITMKDVEWARKANDLAKS